MIQHIGGGRVIDHGPAAAHGKGLGGVKAENGMPPKANVLGDLSRLHGKGEGWLVFRLKK